MGRTTPITCGAGTRDLGNTWHLGEVFLTINGARYYRWRTVDQDDRVLDLLVQSHRNKEVAKKVFRRTAR